jgi:hypothetical protein
MNYDDHEDFNKARLPHEATKEFANARAAVYDKANADFAGGTQDGIVYFTILGLGYLLFLAAT